MKRYLKIYWTLLKLNFATLLIYRSNFISSCFATVLWGVFMIASLFLITSRTSVINGWRREEILVMAGSYSIVITLFHLLFARNFERFANLVNRGELDSILLKPLSSQFLISFWLFHFPNIVRLLLGVFFIGFMLDRMNIAVTFPNVLGYISLMIFSLTLLYSLWFIFATSTIWFSTLTNLHDFLYTVTALARFPREVYSELATYVFAFILPLSLVVATPTRALINKTLSGDIWLLLGCSLGLFLISKAFWKFALRYYTSAN